MARIAIIDDSKLMRKVLRRFLENGGHVVDEWEPSSAMEIYERAMASEFDLFVTDFQMPGANGATVTKMVRKAKPGIPVICMTALRDPEIMELLRRAEVSAVVNKPCTEEEFLWVVDTALAEGPKPEGGAGT